MAIVVNAAEWVFDGWPAADVIAALDKFLIRVEIARERDEKLWIGDDFQKRPILGERDLWSLRNPDSPLQLPQDMWMSLTAWLLSAPFYADDDEWPEGIDDIAIQIDEEPVSENMDVAWVHHHVRAGHIRACIGLVRDGQHLTRSAAGTAIVHWLGTEASNRTFWRNAIVVDGDSEASLTRFAPHAFPDLQFHPNAWGGLRQLAGGYLALRADIRQTLAILDDRGAWAFTFPPPALAFGEAVGPDPTAVPSNQIVETRFIGLGIDVAPENPNVRLSADCRKAREVTIGGATLYCQWHVKLEPHRNRIHIHTPVQESKGKVIVAIFHEHLPLP